jgi:hypothetical protein
MLESFCHREHGDHGGRGRERIVILFFIEEIDIILIRIF